MDEEITDFLNVLLLLLLLLLFWCFWVDSLIDPNLVDKIEMFKAVGLLNKQFTGVTQTSGKLANGKAFHFTDKTTHLIASQEAYNQANKLIHNSHDFSIFAWAKIDSDPSAIYRNTILSVSSKTGSELFLLVMIE